MKSVKRDPTTGIMKYRVNRKGEKKKTLFWFILSTFIRLKKEDKLDETQITHYISDAFTRFYRSQRGKKNHPKRQINLMCYSYLKKARQLFGISTFKTRRRKTKVGKKFLAA